MKTTISSGDFEGSTLIIACPSVGNVSQLAVDIIISTLKPKHIGQIWDEAILPIVGYNPYDPLSHTLCTSADAYHAPEKHLILLQMRAPLNIDQECQQRFLEKLVEFFKNQKVNNIIVLAGLFAHLRHDAEMLDGPFRYVTSRQANELFGKSLSELNWKRMKDNDEENIFRCPRLPGAGCSRKLFNKCTHQSVPCVVLLCYCSDGDNRNDAVMFTNIINEWLKVNPGNDFVLPPSWKFLYGSEIPVGLF